MMMSLCRHYAAKLDGCGLELENNVRRAYRNFIMELIEAHKSYIHPPTKYGVIWGGVFMLYGCGLGWGFMCGCGLGWSLC